MERSHLAIILTNFNSPQVETLGSTSATLSDLQLILRN